MAYVKVDDQFPEHPKVMDIGALAEALWLRGLCYASRNLTDGFIPEGFVRRMGDLGTEEADALIDAGLWEQAPGGYQMHDYGDWQRSREEIEAISEARAEAGRRGGIASGASRREANEANLSNLLRSQRSKTKPDTASDTDTDTDTDVPPIVPPRGDVVKTKPRKRIPNDWALTPTLRGYAVDHGIPRDEVDEFAAEFKRYWQGDGRPKADWDLTFMGRVRDQAGRYQARASPNGQPKGANAFQAVIADARRRDAEDEQRRNGQGADAHKYSLLAGSEGREQERGPDGRDLGESARRRAIDAVHRERP